TQPRRRPAKSPPGIVKTGIMVLARSTAFALHQFFQIADGHGMRELRFTQVDLVAVFEGAEQFDAFEGTELQTAFEVCLWRQVLRVLNGAAGASSQQLG